MNNPNYRIQEELLNLGLGERVMVAMIHESWDAEMWIEIRVKGFGERRDAAPNLLFLDTTYTREIRK
jgi:hypothetical protein